MTVLLFVAASLAGGAGAAVRYAVDGAVARRAGARFPWGIFLVNITGSFALGVVVALLPEAVFIVGAGFLGGYTTFSTAMLDTVALWKDGNQRAAVFNSIAMLLVGLAAAGAGLALGSAL